MSNQVIEKPNVLLDYAETEMTLFEYRRYYFSFEGKGENGEHVLARIGTGEGFAIYKFEYNSMNLPKLKDLPVTSVSVRMDGNLVGEYFK